MEESLITACINGATLEVEGLKHYVHEISTKIDQLEHRLNEVEQFYTTVNKKTSNTCKGTSIENDRHSHNVTKQQQDASFREAAAAKRMQYLIHRFGRIMDQVIFGAFDYFFVTAMVNYYVLYYGFLSRLFCIILNLPVDHMVHLLDPNASSVNI